MEIFVETDKEITESLKRDFSALTEEAREKVIEMTKFLVLTQNTVVPEILNMEKKDINKGVGK
jgi:hypothetical protein